MKGAESAIKKALYGKKKVKNVDINVDVGTPYKPKPHLDVSSEDLPEIKNWKVGETYTIKVKAKMVSLSQRDYNGDKGTCACFEIQKATSKD